MRSSSELNRHLGVHHFPHSKSDVNFLMNGHGIKDSGRSNGEANGHLLLQEWDGPDGFTLIPLSDRQGEETGRPTQSVVRGNSGPVKHNLSLHSRTVFHV